MAIGIRILSDNLSGLTTNVTFLPQSGGTAINLGEQVFPFNYISDYVYGTYNCFVPTYGYTYTLDVLEPTPTPTPTPTLEPLNLTLFAEYTPGSIIASYTLVLNRSYSEEINVTFENVLNVYSGTPITIFTGVTVSSGVLSGETIVTIDENYNNYTGEPLFSQLSGTPSGSTWEIIIIPPIPTSTPTPTPTPSSTPTQTPTQEVLINAILIGEDEYLSVGDNEYLIFTGPTPTTNYYYSTSPVCISSDFFQDVILDGDFCTSTTITSRTELPDGTYWISDSATRRNITALGGLYSFNGDCVGCA
jgi:hypothetical protein